MQQLARFDRAVLALCIGLGIAACEPTQHVVAQIEGQRVFDAGPPPASNSAAGQPAAGQPPPAMTGGTGAAPPVGGTPGADDPPPPLSGVAEGSCAGLAEAWGVVYDTVHTYDCRPPLTAISLTPEQAAALFLWVRDIFSTPVDAGVPAEMRPWVPCDELSPNDPGWVDIFSMPPVYVLCEETCLAAEKWLADKNDDVMACIAMAGD